MTTTVQSRFSALRSLFAEQGIDGFIVPRGDQFMGEYVPASAERLAWLTGFTGSAGTAVVLKDKAALVVDGRYTIQAARQADSHLMDVVPLKDKTAQDWAAATLSEGQVLGYDPHLHTPAGIEVWTDKLKKTGATVKPVSRNLIDAIWTDRPADPSGPIIAHDLSVAGQSSAEKLAALRGTMADGALDAVLISDPHSVNWLFNIRGSDLTYTPIVLARALVLAKGAPVLFIAQERVPDDVRGHLGDVTLADPDAFESTVETLAKTAKKIGVDKASVNQWAVERLKDAGLTVDMIQDPCALPKACKNAVELEGMRAAHVRDGAALTKFLAWLDRAGPAGQETERTAADRLEAFRRESNELRGLSFPSISGAGANGAVVHYSVTAESAAPIAPDMLYLIDSGGQYRDGTTDVTRTVAIGTPTAEQKDRFTRVLKGHIGLARAVFPEGTTGSQLDAFARGPLWEAGLDFDHGTGHGVGAFLSVHEGPHFIASRHSPVALKPGMIVSNEPGYYKEDEFGIRIENLVAVVPAEDVAGERPVFRFETLTLAPIDTRLVDTSLLSPEDVTWLNDYHARVRETVGPLVDEETRTWLAAATAPLTI